jgi:hypothetical protein
MDGKSMTSLHKTLLAGVALIAPACCGLLLSGVPTLLCPFPSLTILPAFLLSPAFYGLAVLLPALLFFSWCPGLLRGEAMMPQRSLVLLGVFTGLTALYFAGSWHDGVEYQGCEFTLVMSAINAG